EMIKANIINTGKSKFMLGYSWLRKANPSIDWRTGEITFGLESPSSTIQQVQVATLVQKGEFLPSGEPRDDGQIATRPCDIYAARVSMATQLSAEADAKKKPQTIEEMVPEYLCDFYSVFDKGTATRLPEHTSYDHEINLKP
ncbi:hypothetical protein DAEQUDRAFT_658474, partial [Daedalea quercina L-15889]